MCSLYLIHIEEFSYCFWLSWLRVEGAIVEELDVLFETENRFLGSTEGVGKVDLSLSVVGEIEGVSNERPRGNSA